MLAPAFRARAVLRLSTTDRTKSAGPALGIQGFRRGETEAVEAEIHEAVAKLKELTTSIDVYAVEREGGLHSGERDLETQLKYLTLVDKRMRKVDRPPSKLLWGNSIQLIQA